MVRCWKNPIKGKNAKAISEFNEFVKNDDRVEHVLITHPRWINADKEKIKIRIDETFNCVYLFMMSGLIAAAQPSADIIEYINNYKKLAMEEMQRTGVPASITLAQGIHETYAGKSELVLKSNNHFGIKCKAYWTGKKVYHDDDARGECFRKYDDPVFIISRSFRFS